MTWELVFQIIVITLACSFIIGLTVSLVATSVIDDLRGKK
jgi:hypothetical protein